MPFAASPADRAAEALGETWAHVTAAIDGGWSDRRPGAVAAFTDQPLPTFNGVWVTDATPAVEDVEALLDRLGDTGRPHCLQMRPDASPELTALAQARGLRGQGAVPLMALEPAEALRVADCGLTIRRLAPHESAAHVAVAAPVFGMPVPVFAGFMRPELLGLAGAACFVGSIDGRDVVTGFGLTLGDAVGVFNVATAESHRRRGYGAAITAHVVREAVRQGATWAWLQSSPSGYDVYQALGFRTVGRWPVFTST